MGSSKFTRERHVSDEGRQRLSEIATERHRNGGFQKKPGTPRRKPSKKRIAARVAAAAREKKNAQAIVEVFKDGVHSSQPLSIRLKAAEAWIKVEQEDTKLMLREAADEGQAMDRAQLLTLLADRLTTGPAADLLRRQIESESGITDAVVESTAIDLPQED
jgi:hypothetical protein